MKKLLAIVLALIMATSVFVGCNKTDAPNSSDSSNSSNSDKNKSDYSEGLKMYLDGDHYVVAGRGKCKDEKIVIPSHYDGVPVTTIYEEAFLDDKTLTSLTIPETVTTIQNNAIRGCSSLAEINLPDSLTELGSGLFWGCNSLPFIEYNEVYYFGDKENPYMFLYMRKNPKIVSHVVHEDTKYICGIGFEGVNTLESITLPEGLLVIDNGAFQLCSELRSITIPDSVTTIYGSAFSTCKNLREVTLGKGLTNLGNYVFAGCRGVSFRFNGTEAEWEAIDAKINWSEKNGVTSNDPICSDTQNQ